MKETLLAGTILVALSGLFGYHGIHAQQRAQVSALQTSLRVAQQNQQAEAEVAAVVQQVRHVGRRLSPTPDPSWLVGEVVKIADTAGVQLASIVHEAYHPDSRGFARLGVSVRFDATYHELGTFLDSLERADAFLRIDGVRASTSVQDLGQGSLQVTLSTVYSPPIKGASGAAL